MNVDAKVIRAVRNARPASPAQLWQWLYLVTGVRLARAHVCRAHTPPFDALKTWFFDRPQYSLTLGGRGSGKSFMAALNTHLCSRFLPRHEARVLGGSEAQSLQIYQGIKEAVMESNGPPPFRLNDRDTFLPNGFGKTFAEYKNGSKVKILPASDKSVRGDHVPLLDLDEVDEIDPEIRQSALGMCMEKFGYSATVIMTSTWHRVGGPMEGLIDVAREQRWPFFTFCSLCVLERCPEERSGPYVGGRDCYERCPECPLVRYCHAERDANGDRPLAKLADGHYTIDSLTQKMALASTRVFEADYLCRGPKADGLWFLDFEERLHVTEAAEFDPRYDVVFALDTGVRTGAVFFQVHMDHDFRTGRRSARVNVFADYYAEHLTPELHTRAITEVAKARCQGRMDLRLTDPAGKARNSSGTVTVGEYRAAGLPLSPWPKVGVRDALTLVEGLLKTADGTVRLTIHPRCVHLINAFRSYRRAKVKGIYVDYPEEPQHPAENLVDPLKNGLVAVIGRSGLAPSAVHTTVHPSRIF